MHQTRFRVHLPGYLKDHALPTLQQHLELWPEAGMLTLDRAYNHLEAHHFQEHVRRCGFDTAYDYPKDDLGPRGAVEGHPVIMIEGFRYVAYMPGNLQMIGHRWKNEEINSATGELYTDDEAKALITEREPYRRKPHGRPDEDG